MPPKKGAGGKRVATPGDPYDPSEFVKGLVAYFDADKAAAAMSGRIAQTQAPHSCDRKFACDRATNFLCLGRRDDARPERSFWLPLYNKPDERRLDLDMTNATGSAFHVKNYYSFHPGQAWVLDDDIVIQLTQEMNVTPIGEKCDESEKANRNRVAEGSVPDWEDLAGETQRWAKMIGKSVPKEEVAKAERDPSDPSRLFRDFEPSQASKMDATMERDQKRIKDELCEQYPDLADGAINDLFPKGKLMTVPGPHGASFVVSLASDKPEVVFFQHLLSPYIPTLRTLHKYPYLLPKHRVDIGGCKYVLSGANLMCQGLTSEAGSIAPGVKAGNIVAIYVEGKDHAAAVGIATLSSKKIEEVNQGVCAFNVHHLGDGLWKHPFLG